MLNMAAGEVECQLNLADCLTSGSVSFGRFESELLSWQRRSSFGYNRYLDDVERYSTPGLVTQTKAYFEAEFKKRALLRRSSSDHHSSPGCQEAGSRETKTESTGYLSHPNTEEKDFTLPGQKLVVNGPPMEDEKYGGCCQIPTSLDGHECKAEVKQHQEVFAGALSSCNLADHDEHQFSTGETLILKEKLSEISIEQSSKIKNHTLEKILGKRSCSLKSPMGGKDSAPSQKKTQKANLVVKATVEHNYSKGKPAVPIVSRSLYNKETVTSNTTSPKTFRRTENAMLPGKIDNISLFRFPLSMYYKSRNLKSEDTEKLRANLKEEMRRPSNGKDLRPTKDTVSLTALTKKPAKGASSSELDTKPSIASSGLTTPEKKKETVVSQIKSRRPQSNVESLVNMTSHKETSPGSSKVSSRSHPSSQLPSPIRLDRYTASNGHASIQDLSVKAAKQPSSKANTPAANSNKTNEVKKDQRYRPTLAGEVKKAEMVGRARGSD